MAISNTERTSKTPKQHYFDTLYELDGSSADESGYNHAAATIPPSFERSRCHIVEQSNHEIRTSPHDVRSSSVSAGDSDPPHPNANNEAPLPSTSGAGHINVGRSAGNERIQRNDDSTVEPTAPPQILVAATQHPLQPQTHTNPRRLPRTVSAPIPAILRMGSSFASTVLAKHKREVVLNMVPEDKQVFKGLKFYFIPPDDVNPDRRARIKRAREHGAEWIKDWNGGKDIITHIIADMRLTYTDITKYFKINDLPSEQILVNEDYTGDCLKYRFMVNPNQIQYEVRGHNGALKRQAGELPSSPTTEPDSARSLQIKAKLAKPGRWDYVPPRNTPDRSDQSSFGSALERTSGSQHSILGVETSTSHSAQNRATPATGAANSSRKRASPASVTATAVPALKRSKPLTYGRKELDAVLKQAASLIQPNRPKDELHEVMEEARNLQDLPLDSSDDESSHSTSKSVLNLNSFSCMRGGSVASTSDNPNARTIAILQEMADYYNRMNDTWRTMGYRKAITTLKSQTTKISTSAEAVKLPNIGTRLADKIEEIVVTDRLRRLESTKDDESDAVLRLFLGIYGVGIKQASQWQAQGYRTLDDLVKDPSVKLTENQKFGIERYDDLQKRIPRLEVAEIGSIILDTARNIDQDVQVIIGGSYRRGADTCGDIDILVSKSYTDSVNELTPFFTKLIRKLRAANVLTAALSVGRTEDSSKWQGCCVLPKRAGGTDVWRRIDFHVAPARELGAALIYFTGNDVFNRSIRLLAKKKGMRLNQRGLYRSRFKDKRGVSRGGELVEGEDEKRIFKALGVPWREPTDRVC